MSRRPNNRDQRHIPSPRTDKPSAVRGDGMPANAAADQITGIVGDASVTSGQSRSGEDVRRRGWFWHWNNIITQFAPIIGLKGVGLLNSYTVWTDRREDSRHRGYAFPSQQSEADFYGEDRNELITINKLLVALDLIEIRKEMVPRTDAQGRRWKVPHNLYRVKDHGDDFNLTTADVMRVARLAEKDRAVYRYVRRIFSPRFAPIDRDNIWHQILEEVREIETWQKLAARTERDEKRASARSKAGHASRRTSEESTSFSLPNGSDTTSAETTAPDTNKDSVTGDSNDSTHDSETSAADINNGLEVDAAQGNNGWDEGSATPAALVNTGQATSVAPTSTTYYQELTTTTKKKSEKIDSSPNPEPMSTTDSPELGLPPDDRRDEDATVTLFDEANSRPTSAAARRHLRQIAEGCVDLARSAGVSGWTLVGSAIDEAVASGSAFVAPKRVREIIARWERDGVPVEYANASPAESQPVTGVGDASHRSALQIRNHDSQSIVGSGIVMPSGRDAADIWDETCRSLAGTLPAVAIRELASRVTIAGYAAGEVTLEVADQNLAERLRDEWGEQIQRKLGVALRRPVRIVVTTTVPEDPDPDPEPTRATNRLRSASKRTPVAGPSSSPREIPHFRIAECGMSGMQVWTSVVDDLRQSGAIPKAEVDTWLRDSALLGRDPETDALIVGVPHALAERRAARFLAAIETATMQVVGFDCEISIVRTQDWLAANTGATGTEG
ncbi:MAG TPA: hypothetical protein VNZ58_06810 [Thermomicrobiales bacterium]|nr:hypothetical protein [Thermomicrobiales bacterium]